jgi:hypothetical protein
MVGTRQEEIATEVDAEPLESSRRAINEGITPEEARREIEGKNKAKIRRVEWKWMGMKMDEACFPLVGSATLWHTPPGLSEGAGHVLMPLLLTSLDIGFFQLNPIKTFDSIYYAHPTE